MSAFESRADSLMALARLNGEATLTNAIRNRHRIRDDSEGD
jgi:hypothetical protein